MRPGEPRLGALGSAAPARRADVAQEPPLRSRSARRRACPARFLGRWRSSIQRLLTRRARPPRPRSRRSAYYSPVRTVDCRLRRRLTQPSTQITVGGIVDREQQLACVVTLLTNNDDAVPGVDGDIEGSAM